MADKSFVLVSLKDSKSKSLTKVLSNATCRKILDYLSKVESATETEISNTLKVPLSTVHYNIKQLADSKLVSQDEYHYSEKGKEVIHYKLANKFIVISQGEEDDSSILDKLKSFLPVIIIFTVISGLVAVYEYISRFFSTGAVMFADKAFESAPEAKLVVTSAANQLVNSTAPSPSIPTHDPYVALWIFLGGLGFLLIMLAFDFVKNTKDIKKSDDKDSK